MNQEQVDREIEQNARFNMVVNAIEGIVFWTGAGFFAASTILPVYVSHYTNSTLLIGLIPFIANSCYLLPQLFTSNWTSRLPRKKFLPINVGLFTERLPLLLMPLPVLLFARSAPGLALASFFILYAWNVTGAGVILVGWQDMIARIIPADRRGRFFGITNFGGTAGGILSAYAIAWLLSRYTFPTGYVLGFAAGGILIMIGWLFLAQTREPPIPNPQPSISTRQFFRTLPGVVRKDHNFRRLLGAQIALGMSGMGSGFVIVYVTRNWNLPDSQAGIYTMVMLIGQALTNLWIGSLADRRGHKLILELTALFSAGSYLLAWLSPNPAWYFPVFALRGAGIAASMLSGMLIALEFSTPELRPTYIGLNSTISGIANAISPIIGGALAIVTGYPPLFGLSALIALGAFILFHWTVREPRHVLSTNIPLAESDEPAR